MRRSGFLVTAAAVLVAGCFQAAAALSNNGWTTHAGLKTPAWGVASARMSSMLRLRGGMKIFNDIVSGDEMMSDSFPIELIDDVVLKVETKSIVKGAVEVDIGANAAAGDGEGGAAEDDGVDDTAVRVNDVVDAFNLQSMGAMDKKGILEWVKGYLKVIKERLEKEDPDRVAVFQEKSSKWVKEFLLKNAADVEFYTGPSFNCEGALAMFIYEGENHHPHCYLLKDGLREEKC